MPGNWSRAKLITEAIVDILSTLFGFFVYITIIIIFMHWYFVSLSTMNGAPLRRTINFKKNVCGVGLISTYILSVC